MEQMPSMPLRKPMYRYTTAHQFLRIYQLLHFRRRRSPSYSTACGLDGRVSSVSMEEGKRKIYGDRV